MVMSMGIRKRKWTSALPVRRNVMRQTPKPPVLSPIANNDSGISLLSICPQSPSY